MPLTLEQYAEYLDTRMDLSWPAPPEIKRAKARPHLERLPEVRAVTWSVYGTLLAIAEADLLFEHPHKFIMDLALDKTIQEFKMWKAMTRKPGQPAAYMRSIYGNVLDEQRLQPTTSEKHPEFVAEKLWESIIKKLLENEYTFDAGSYGSLNDFSRKVAYFYHANLQGTKCYPGAAKALQHVKEAGLTQGLLADGQCFTALQLERGLKAEDASAILADLVPPQFRVLSCEVRARKPSARLFREMLSRLHAAGIATGEVLHIGNSLERDVAPARKLGLKTGLFAGDKHSLQGKAEQLQEPKTRPDVLLTELPQIAEVVG
jgi:FMN phosphatase YigB (HAD superfamily)